jgi:hypothetical protein
VEIVDTQGRTLTPDEWTFFDETDGPATVVHVIFGDLEPGESVDLRLIGTSDLVSGVPDSYVLEQVTIPDIDAHKAGYQTMPVPLPDDQWSVTVALRLTGGSLTRDFAMVAIVL